jgi:integrase
LLGEIARGDDPANKRDEAKGAPTVRELAARYLAEHVDVHNRPSTAKTFRRLVNVHVVPALGSRRVIGVTRADATKLHFDLRVTPRQANQTMAVLSKMMHMAEAWGWRPDNSNPCRLVKRFSETKRERFYSDAELSALGLAVASLEREGKIFPGCAAAIRLAALTGCRMGEVLALQWGDVEIESGTLQIREGKAGGRIHTVGAPVLALLASLGCPGSFVVWSTNPNKPLPQSTLEKAWERVRDKAGVANARFHDLRHTVGTYAGQTGAGAFLVRDALGHRTLAMTGRYVNRDTAPLRELSDRVAGRIAAAMENAPAAQIAPLQKREA